MQRPKRPKRPQGNRAQQLRRQDKQYAKKGLGWGVGAVGAVAVVGGVGAVAYHHSVNEQPQAQHSAERSSAYQKVRFVTSSSKHKHADKHTEHNDEVLLAGGQAKNVAHLAGVSKDSHSHDSDTTSLMDVLAGGNAGNSKSQQ